MLKRECRPRSNACYDVCFRNPSFARNRAILPSSCFNSSSSVGSSASTYSRSSSRAIALSCSKMAGSCSSSCHSSKGHSSGLLSNLRLRHGGHVQRPEIIKWRLTSRTEMSRRPSNARTMKRVAHQAPSRPKSCVHESRMLYVPEGVFAYTPSRKEVQANQPQVVRRKDPMTMTDL